ncbi:nucleotide-binding protein [Nocardiopsis metallicus]|uniref:Chromosome partitioning protein n=1 Tax=Nocardiopsis metallicus TaxID=179819 RepID=A0A840WS01_9ACTN|nr:AAA family ATPase [Nocardiopsis metallicus]MBB5495801.1 chromosome partitioning protein [Nocardiopsis metallicus]
MRASIAYTNTKPGTGKTTTSVLVAQSLHQRGFDVLLVDADPAQSALAWSDEVGGFGFKIVGLATKDAGRRLGDFAGPDTLVIVDLPQAEDHGAIVRSVLRHVDEITIPVAPSTIEIDRTGAITELLEEVAEVRQAPARIAVLLNRVVSGARSGRDAREGLEAMGYDVLDSQIPRREAYALAYGAAPEVPAGDPIEILADEYLRRAGIEVAAA